MALSALRALARVAARITVHAPAWGADLYRDLGAEVVPRGTMDRADVAVLFPPSFRAAWEARRVPRRVGIAADHRAWLLTDVVAPGTHRLDTYAALAAAVGAAVDGPPAFAVRPEDPEVDVPRGHVGLNPVSPSGAPVTWTGFAALSVRLDRPIVWYGGPGEEADVAEVAPPGASRRVGLSLPAFARALTRCAVFVSNDSGAAHFARACGVPVVVVHGSTTAARTGPAGALAVEGPELPCRPCYRKRCRFGLECLEIPVQRVLDAVGAAVEAG